MMLSASPRGIDRDCNASSNSLLFSSSDSQSSRSKMFRRALILSVNGARRTSLARGGVVRAMLLYRAEEVQVIIHMFGEDFTEYFVE